MTLRRVGFTQVPPGAKPGFDHADTYQTPTGSRIYVAHTGADRVDVIDCATGAYLRSIDDLPGVAGVLIDSTQDLLFTSDRAAARVSIFRASDEQLLGRVSVGQRPNALAYDPGQRELFSFDLGEPVGTKCTVSAVSVDELGLRTTLGLPGRPRWAVFDRSTQAVYANIADPAEIVVIDTRRRVIRDTIPIAAAGPHGLAIVADRSGASLWCAADAGTLVVVERASHRVAASLPLPGAPDVIMYDKGLRRVYVAVGSPGAVVSFDVERHAQLESIDTEEGAHTIGWDPATRRLFVFEPKSEGVAIYEDAE
jgi:DNA-binding beta-propeller fold protein YncE